ncbi:MAG TPA: protein kinase, partial [Polyangium sp.]|nr:protein kinase [Polyangium sp.]
MHQRFDIHGTTPHRHDGEALQWLRDALPEYDPYGGISLFSFSTSDGRRYEIDALAMTTHCLYVIEMKSWLGTVVDGDVRHLVTESPERGRETVPHPLPLLEVKTKALLKRLQFVARRMGKPEVTSAMDELWAEPLVWLTHATACKLRDYDAAKSHVIVGKTALGDLIRQASFPGARDDLPGFRTPKNAFKFLRRVLAEPEFGLRNIDKPLSVLDGQFNLAELVEEGEDYQDHWAHPQGRGPRCRVRSYLVPKSDRAFVAALERRVEREARVLVELEDHPNILALQNFDPRAPLGPALIFRGFPGLTLDAFLRQERGDDGRSKLTLDDKLALLRDIADALTFCHRKDIVHGALSPEAILVQRSQLPRSSVRSPFDVKLTRFALAGAGEHTTEPTRLFTRLAGATASLYEAPELVRGEAPSRASDLFSLGALAYYLLAEEPPARHAVELQQRLLRDGGLFISSVRDDLFPVGAHADLDQLLWEITAHDATKRLNLAASPLEFISLLEDALRPSELPERPVEIDPLEAVKNDKLGDLEVLGPLGTGATARVFKVRHPREGLVALKVPLSEAQDDRIAAEAEVLEKLRRIPGVDRVAHFIEKREIAGRTCLLVQLAGDRTLAEELRTEGTLSLDYARRWGDDLLTALRSLEEAGIQHRDIKPANIGLTGGAEKGKKRLLLFDFSLSSRPANELGIGTPAYKDPELLQRGLWDDAADRWAAAITLHEMFTGVRPAMLPINDGEGVAVRVDEDRLDPDVRHGLVRFFEKAFAFHAAKRFSTAEDMRDHFTHALHKVPDERADDPDERDFDPAKLEGLSPKTRVAE